MCCKKQPFGTAFQSKPHTRAPVFVSMIPATPSRSAASIRIMVLAISLVVASPGESLAQSNESGNTIELERFLVRGLTFMRTGYPDKASLMFSEGLKLHPTHPALLASMADAQQALGDFTSASFYMNGALLARPGDIDLHRQAYLLALESGDTESSLRHSTQILTLSPSDVMAFTRHIELLMALNRKSMAATQAQRGVPLFPGEEGFLRTAIRAFESVGDLENAAISYESLVGVTQDPADRHALALVLMRAGSWEEAADQLILVLNEEFDNREALASLLALQSSLPGRDLSREIESILGLVLEPMDDTGVSTDSLHYYQNAQTAAPDDPDRSFDLANFLFRSEQFEEMVLFADRQIERDPKQLRMWLLSIRAQLELGAFESALAVAEDAILLFPGYVPFAVELVVVLASNDRVAEAIDQARLVLSGLGPRDPAAARLEQILAELEQPR